MFPDGGKSPLQEPHHKIPQIRLSLRGTVLLIRVPCMQPSKITVLSQSGDKANG